MLDDCSALALEKIGDGAAQAQIPDPMGAVGPHRQIAAGKFVLALCACFDAGELVLNGEVDRLVVADLEMKAGMLLERAPIAAVQRIGADEVERTGDGAAGPFRLAWRSLPGQEASKGGTRHHASRRSSSRVAAPGRQPVA